MYDIVKKRATRLARVRQRIGDYDSQARAALARLEENPDWQDYCKAREQIAKAKGVEKRAKETLGKAAVKAFQTSGAKKLIDGVEVKERVVAIYDEQKAIDWAIANARIYLKLDTRLFEKHVKAKKDSAPVTIGKEPFASIATDLSQYV